MIMIIYDHIIIGSGIAGLYAGFKLGQKKILVLEKNSYIGGRAQNISFHKTSIPTGAGIGRFKKDKLLKKLLSDLDIPINRFSVNISYSFIPSNVKKIFKYLKSVYNGEQNLTFKQFALKHIDLSIYKLFVRSIGLTDYENEDVEETLFRYGMEDNMDGWEAFGVSWNIVVNKLAQSIKFNGNKIKTNSGVELVQTCENWLEVSTLDKKYFCTNVIIACEITGIRKLLPQFTHLYSNIKSNSFIRIYGHFIGKSKLLMEKLIGNTTYVNTPLYKIIPIDAESGVYMLAYSDNKAADKLIDLIESNNEITWLEQMVSKSLSIRNNSTQLQINEISYFYWKDGTHYFRPLSETVYTTRKKYIQAIQNPKPNIYVCGEAVAKAHGWIEGALESVEFVLGQLNKMI